MTTYYDLINKSPYRFYLRIITASFLRMKMTNTKKILDNMPPLNNEEFISEIKSYHRERNTIPTTRELISTHQGFFSKILNYFKMEKIETYLDFGCGSGVISQSVGELLNVEPEGIDIIDQKIDIIYHQYDGKMLNLNKKYDLITCFHVLHHTDLSMVPQLISLLAPNGYLLVKEHNCYNEEIKLLIELQHLYCDHDHIMPIRELHNKQFWIELFGELELISEYKEVNNPTASFYMLFRNVEKY